MIVVTGAAGFIGSNLVSKLNQAGYLDIVLVDDFSREEKRNNYKGKNFSALVSRERFPAWLDDNHRFVQFIFHLGARTDTTEMDWSVFKILNLDYSQMVWKKAVQYGLPLIYASSAATYGEGEYGYTDDHELVPRLQPLNPYGKSKNDFDLWALKQEQKPFFWAGIKFFNVYGPNEYHKARMASVIFHSFNQIMKEGRVRLFRSHRPDYDDGEQLRDFVYVKDAVDVLLFLMENRKISGIYNLGTGKAETFNELVCQCFMALDLKPVVQYIDTPADIRDKYQYFTEADMSKLRSAGYTKSFQTLSEGVPDYVKHYLAGHKYN